jgi:hypothetical protein
MRAVPHRRRFAVWGVATLGLASLVRLAPTRAGNTLDVHGGFELRPLPAPVPFARLHVDGEGRLHAVSNAGVLWEYQAAGWQVVPGGEVDPGAPLADGDGRLVARGRDGTLLVFEAGRRTAVAEVVDGPGLSAHGGMLVLRRGVIAIVAGPAGSHVPVRFEPDGTGRWREVARSTQPVLPDARPVLFAPDGTASDAEGEVALLGDPSTRYRHAVLGDDIEATSLVLLGRRRLEPIARLSLSEPHVLEDIAPRPIRWRGRRALLTVRAGPVGAQVAVVGRPPDSNGELRIEAMGAPIGQRNRWLAPTTDGERILAVHTPHIGGILHRYADTGDVLAGVAVLRDVTNHVLGDRDLDVSAWVAGVLVMPSQDMRRLRIVDPDLGADTGATPEVALDARVRGLWTWPPSPGRRGVVALLSNGSVVALQG